MALGPEAWDRFDDWVDWGQWWHLPSCAGSEQVVVPCSTSGRL